MLLLDKRGVRALSYKWSRNNDKFNKKRVIKYLSVFLDQGAQMHLKIQRKLVMRICSSLRTVPTNTLLVLASMKLINLQIRERIRKLGRKKWLDRQRKRQHCTTGKQNGPKTPALVAEQETWSHTSKLVAVGRYIRKSFPFLNITCTPYFKSKFAPV